MMSKKYITYKESLSIIKSKIDKILIPNKTNFILIWGASAVGKTTLAYKLMSSMGYSSVLSVDSYLTEGLLEKSFNHDPINSDIPYIEGLDPKIWDLEIMNRDLMDLYLGVSINIPKYNYETKNRDGYLRFNPKKIIFIEGSYSMDNSVSELAALSILIYADLHDRLIRKIARTVIINKRTDIDASINRYLRQTNPSLEYYTNLYKNRFNFIVHNPLMSRQEFEGLMSCDTVQSQGYIILIPNKGNGIIKHGEELRFYAHNNKLVYVIDDKILFSVKINNGTYKLLTNYYKNVST